MDKKPQTQEKAYVEESGTSPPTTVVVEHDYKTILILPNGRVLVRKAGF